MTLGQFEMARAELVIHVRIYQARGSCAHNCRARGRNTGRCRGAHRPFGLLLPLHHRTRRRGWGCSQGLALFTRLFLRPLPGDKGKLTIIRTIGFTSRRQRRVPLPGPATRRSRKARRLVSAGSGLRTGESSKGRLVRAKSAGSARARQRRVRHAGARHGLLVVRRALGRGSSCYHHRRCNLLGHWTRPRQGTLRQ